MDKDSYRVRYLQSRKCLAVYAPSFDSILHRLRVDLLAVFNHHDAGIDIVRDGRDVVSMCSDKGILIRSRMYRRAQLVERHLLAVDPIGFDNVTAAPDGICVPRWV